MITPSDFQRESYRIDEQIWDALSLKPGETALFLGLANGGAWLGRAVEIGVKVWAVASDDAAIARITKLGATALRGSATMIPAVENAYDVAIAFHYLHEVDPGFHAQIVSELGRVGKRVAVVEPAPRPIRSAAASPRSTRARSARRGSSSSISRSTIGASCSRS